MSVLLPARSLPEDVGKDHFAVTCGAESFGTLMMPSSSSWKRCSCTCDQTHNSHLESWPKVCPSNVSQVCI